MDLIDRAALGIGKCNPAVFNDENYGKGWNSCIELIEKAPTVPAVPLEPLCEWLANLFGCPCNFSPIDERMFKHCEEDCVNDDIECWKRVLKQWMEESGKKESGKVEVGPDGLPW